MLSLSDNLIDLVANPLVMPFLELLSGVSAEQTMPLTVREAASGLLGSISLTCWIFLLVRFPPSYLKYMKRGICTHEISPITGPPTDRKLPQWKRRSHLPPLHLHLVRWRHNQSYWWPLGRSRPRHHHHRILLLHRRRRPHWPMHLLQELQLAPRSLRTQTSLVNRNTRSDDPVTG